MSRQFAIWLLPREPERAALRACIRQLARRHAAVEFEPHVTVFAGRRARSDTVGRDLAGEVASLPPVTLRDGRYGSSADFFKAVFVGFQRDPLLERLSRGVGSRLTEPQAFHPMKPRLALLFKMVAERDRHAIIDALPPAQGTMVCDELVVVGCGQNDYWYDVAGWRIEERVPLAAATQ